AAHRKRILGGKLRVAASFQQPDRSLGVVELAGLSAHVIFRACAFDVLLVGSALNHHMAIGLHVTGRLVVDDFVGPQNRVAIADFTLAAQCENISVLFLLPRLDDDFVSHGMYPRLFRWFRSLLLIA